MKIECQEWSAQDEFGERADMGIHLYSEVEVYRVLQGGGVIEVGERHVNNHYDAAAIFAA